MADHLQPQLCVVGAGALGIALAQHAKALGASVALVDRGVPEPGDGPQTMLRLAALQASAGRAHAQRHGAALGLTSSEPKISIRTVQERAKALAVSHSAMTDLDRLGALGIEIVRGSASFLDQNRLMVGDVQVRAAGFILALGGRPLVPAIPGLEQIAYFTPDSILENTRKLTHLLVIGADGAALSLAQTYARLGSEVTLVPQGNILAEYDPESAAILLDILEGEGVRIMTGAQVQEIIPRSQGTGASVLLPSGETEALDVSHVLLANGTSADLSALEPEKARLRPTQKAGRHYASGPLGQTTNRRVRVVGAAAGIDQLSYALTHGRAVVEQMILGAPAARLAPQPHLVQTEPPLAQIGRIASRSDKARPGQRLLRASLAETEYARAISMAQGLAKVELAPDGRVLGAGLVGPGAADMAGVLALAMEKDIALHDLARLSLPQPSPLSALIGLGEQAAALRTVSPWSKRWRAARQMISSWRR